MTAGAVGSEPRTLSEALSRDDACQWKEAWELELKQLQRLRTWKLVPRLTDKPVIPFSHVFKIKLGSNGEILKYKVRLVAGGHRQVKGLNYNETFAAAAKIASITKCAAEGSSNYYCGAIGSERRGCTCDRAARIGQEFMVQAPQCGAAIQRLGALAVV